ncbi:hypothetical protein [Hoylesella timonensis]|nr:hypothetical protein [Hoylesella timonensis]
MLQTRHRRIVLWYRIAPDVTGIVERNFNWMIVQDIIQQPRLCAMAGKNFNRMIVQDIMQQQRLRAMAGQSPKSLQPKATPWVNV